MPFFDLFLALDFIFLTTNNQQCKMKRVIICLVIFTLGCITAFAQEEGQSETDFSSSRKILNSMPINSKIETKESLFFDNKLPPALDSKALFTSPLLGNPTFLNSDLSNVYKFKYINLQPYNQRVLQLGLGEINNMGATVIWQGSDKISLEGSAFISQQYGYIHASKQTLFGVRMNVNYQFNNQFKMGVWGQYLFNQNNDQFLKSMNAQPKTGVGIRLEYAPTINTKYSIGTGYEESIFNTKRFNSMIEFKVKIYF